METVTVYYLEMNSPSALKPKSADDLAIRVGEVKRKNWKINRFFYTLVGSDWTWTDKLPWSDSLWQEYAERDALRTFIGYLDDSPIGYFELETRGDEIDIAMFGIEPRSTGLGLGGQLLTEAIRIAWTSNPRLVTVNTCTLDHPGALPNYLSRGFSLVRQHEKKSQNKN